MTDENVVENVEVVDADEPVAEEKVVVYYVNADGSKEVKSRGRTRLGYVKGDDGNYHADPNFDLTAHKAAKVKPVVDHFYVTFDENGVEISREKISRGRPKKDFVRQDNGDFHLTLTPKTEEADNASEQETVEVADVSDEPVAEVEITDTDSVELTDEDAADETPIMVDDTITE